ncbi:succinate-semialdehyde dehydrogenase/glutarate-semialdehyde dehydrogenase [Murinocardiopsis flavida]|uniref:Succinate-semialdehyde dehydrogenase/glutarate-semialdehyde dehydrogenase n=1 Tax=Murinocardiopsis flavida TaxID=645275 RepID=A0A2P8DF94_9ACTN|nr:aldehyde dehydrogenase family protein [Murinocardiopsis flavida]PSK95885.1 succinate-semialdehyde dehydrogenase/glutarate-semialdehyde dehydrogenase [Murinocardiopsis flavida]
MTAIPVRNGVRINGGPADPEVPWRSTVLDPATGAACADLVGGAEPEARRALDAAAAALDGWSAAPAAHRAAALRGIAADLRAEPACGEIAALITRETGKRIAEARAEVGLSAAFFDWFADAAGVRAGASLSVVPGLRHEVAERALGVVAVLTPWNFPVSIPARKIAPAVAAGCTVLFKPSEVAPGSALRLAEIVEAHVPPGVIGTVIGAPEAVADTWLADPRVRGLTFTGSTRVGRILAAAAAPRFVRCVLELGGNAPFVVLDGADLDRAVEILMVAKYRNNGQSCIAANQVWVPSDVLEDFAQRFADASAGLVLGDPMDERTTLGPLALPSDGARVAALVDEAGGAVQRGAMPLPAEGHFARPAVCVRPDPGSRLVTEEVFGPAVSVRGYGALGEVVGAVRDGRYGLGGYVVGEPVRAAEVARTLDVGIVGVNTGTPNHPRVPFAGLKDSGVGVEGGYGGLEEFLTGQTVAVGDR